MRKIFKEQIRECIVDNLVLILTTNKLPNNGQERPCDQFAKSVYGCNLLMVVKDSNSILTLVGVCLGSSLRHSDPPRL